MKVFIYKTEVNDKIQKKRIKALSKQQALSFLKRKKVVVISIKEEGASLLGKLLSEKTVPNEDIVAFSQLFAGCIRSGLTIKESLKLLEKQLSNKLLQTTLSDIIDTIEGGSSLSDAFNLKTNIFPKFYPMLLKAGEASGNLASVLEYIGNYLEKTNDLKKQIKSTLTYPIIVSSVGLILLIIILTFVAPTFEEVFSKSGQALPVPSIILFTLSSLVLAHKTFLLTVIILAIVLSTLFFRSDKGKVKCHYFFLVAPLTGPLTRNIIMLRFLGAFEILINNDVPLLQTLQVIEDSTSNLYLKRIIIEMRKEVSKGLPLSGPLLHEKKVISPMIAYSISTGEKSGNLGDSLKRMTHFMDREITYSMKKLSSRLDPLLTLTLGLIVLFVALAIYLPIFDMMSTL